jgi:hypothetical protein
VPVYGRIPLFLTALGDLDRRAAGPEEERWLIDERGHRLPLERFPLRGEGPGDGGTIVWSSAPRDWLAEPGAQELARLRGAVDFLRLDLRRLAPAEAGRRMNLYSATL